MWDNKRIPLRGGLLLGFAGVPALRVEQGAVGAGPGELLDSVLHVGERVGGGFVVTASGDESDIDYGENGGESEHACLEAQLMRQNNRLLLVLIN